MPSHKADFTSLFLEQIIAKLDEIEKLLKVSMKGESTLPEYLDTKQVAKLLRVSESTIHWYTSHRKIPFYKPSHRILLFKRDEIFAFIDKGKVNTQEAINDSIEFSTMRSVRKKAVR